MRAVYLIPQMFAQGTRGIWAGVLLGLLTASCTGTADMIAGRHGFSEESFAAAEANGRMANEALVRSQRLMVDWLAQADPRTGLLPRNLSDSLLNWNAKDAAADLYPFLVLTASFTDPALFEGRMQEILLTETALTSRVGRLPDTYEFSKQDFSDESPDMTDIVFGSSEYIKDGLMPLTEWLGASPWRARMLGLLDDVWHYASVETPYGAIVSTNPEVNGEMLQVLARAFWMTDEVRYLDYAVRLGDYYLFGGRHPTRDFEQLRLRDHGNEIVSGLTELYATLRQVRPEKAAAYREPVHAMLDRILDVGRNEHGLFYNVIDPRSGEVLNDGIADNFGYILNGFYTVYLVDEKEAYREAVRQVLGTLDAHYDRYDWERGSADGDADAVEGALNLYNREPVPSAAEWIERQTRFMWSKQDSAHRAGTETWRGRGIVEGWHGDGNFARTSLMVALWKTQGTSLRPWREDVVLGAVREDDDVLIYVKATDDWRGRLRFDAPRHRTQMRLPSDWPRINQFPEWFTVEAARQYAVFEPSAGVHTVHSGEELLQGIPLRLESGEDQILIVRPL